LSWIAEPVQREQQLLLRLRSASGKTKSSNEPSEGKAEAFWFVETEWFAGQDNLTAREFDVHPEVVKMPELRFRRKNRGNRIVSVDRTTDHSLTTEVVADFDLNLLEIGWKVEMQGVILVGTLPENGDLQDESLNARLRPLVSLTLRAEIVSELVGEDQQISERP
jgi:hypothetical protein